jgi:PEGA domain-containing protein
MMCEKGSLRLLVGGFVFQTEEQSEPTASVVGTWWARSGWTSLLMAVITAVSAVLAFTAVRAWYVPVRATGLVPATLTVETQPPGAELLIDTVPRGTAPLTVAIEPGSHLVTVRQSGFERQVRVTVAAGAQMSQYFDLTSSVRATSSGRLSILTDPPGARVTVDDRLRGVSPLTIDDLAEGKHTITVTSDTGSARRTVAVNAAVAKEVVFSLPRSTAPTAGWLTVASPFPVDIIEGDEVIGTSGTAKITLLSGRHDVVLRNDSLGYAAPQTIDVVAGRTASVEVKPPTGLLNVNATPWADVLIDGRPAGQTPLGNIELPIGPHQITFRHPELGERTRRVLVAAQGVSRVAENLTK